MGRTESKQAFQQSSAQSAENQANSRAALGSTNEAVGDYTKRANRFTDFGRRVYGAGGEYARTQNTLGTTAAAAGNKAMEGNLAMRALRTGENTGGYASALGEEQREASRDLTKTLAGADADRLNKLTAIEQQGVEAAKFPAGVYGSLYGTSVGGANNAMGNATSAAKTPGFWDVFAPALAGAAGTAAAGMA